MISWPAADGIRWVNPSIATVSPSRTNSRIAAASSRIGAIAIASTPIVRRKLRVHVDPHRLRTGVFLDRLDAEVAAVAGAAHAAERRSRVGPLVAIYPDHPGDDLPGHAMSPREVAGPEPAAQDINGVVGDGDYFVFILERGDRHERAENLLLADAIRGPCTHHGRHHVASLRQFRAGWRFTAEQDLAALFARDLAVGEHAVAMGQRSQRPHLGLRIERIAESDRRRELEEAVEKFVGYAFVQQQPRARDTGLALVVKDRERAAVERRVEVGVVEYDIGPLAAELELDPLEVTRRGLNDPAPGRGRTGEGDFLHPRMLGQVLAGNV